MTLNERILDFLDGSLTAEDEAELLHTLSVSPEKREMLRGFMEQRSLFAHDSKMLSVPYETEQRLWARLDQVMPVESQSEAPALLPVETPSSGFFAHALRSVSTMASAITLFAGIGIGYFAGAHHAIVPNTILTVHSPVAQEISRVSAGTTFHMNRAITQSSVRAVHTPLLAALPSLPIQQNVLPSNVLPLNLNNLPVAQNLPNGSVLPTAVSHDSTSQVPMISNISARSLPAIAMKDIGGDSGSIKPMFHQIRATREAEPSFLDRFEFRVNESIGREFPNNIATNVSQPFITNTSVSTFFQVLAHSNLLWAGVGYGTANVTQKQLYVAPGDPIDPSQQVLAADTAHAQTSYFAGMAELRLPAFATTDLTFDAGYGVASLGQMLFGEIGLHYNISEEVGAICGLRVLRFSYDLSGEKATAIQSGTSGLAISNAVAAAGPSFNTELNAGLFFHF
jgi:hypothetical protein